MKRKPQYIRRQHLRRAASVGLSHAFVVVAWHSPEAVRKLVARLTGLADEL